MKTTSNIKMSTVKKTPWNENKLQKNDLRNKETFKNEDNHKDKNT